VTPCAHEVIRDGRIEPCGVIACREHVSLAGLLDRRPELADLTAMAERVGMEVAGC